MNILSIKIINSNLSYLLIIHKKNYELSLRFGGKREIVGWRISGSSTRPRAAKRRGEVQDYLRLHQFLRIVIVALVIIILIRFVWSSSLCICMHNRCFWHYSQVIWTLLHANVEEGWKQGFLSWSMIGTCFQREEFVWGREVCPHFMQGIDVYVLCVHVFEHTHTLHVGYSGVGTRHLESPEEI